MKYLILIIIFNSILLSDVYYYSYGEKRYLKPVKDSRTMQGIKYYKNEAGQKVGVKDEVLIKCKKETPCLQTVKKYKFESVKELTPTIIFVKLNSNQDSLEISLKLSNEENISFAHPNFIKKRYKR